MQRILIIILLTFQFCVQAQNWESVGTRKFNHEVDQLYSDTASGILYNTGMYWMIDTTAAYGLAEWDSVEWQPAFVDCINNAQKRITRFQGQLYVSKSPYLLKWNGISWDTAATSDGGFFDLYNDGDSVLYAVGTFAVINGIPISDIARYDGSSWSGLGSIIWTGGATCAYRYQGQMYFGGIFSNTAANIWRIARWDGANWNAVGGGITGSVAFVQCMEEYNGELYVGGYMATSQGNPGNFIARWNGTSWSQVGGGMAGGQVNNLKVFNNELWAVGMFSSAGGVPATNVAKYDGVDWCGVGTFDNAINAIEVHNNELYIGGNFWTVDGDSVNKVVKWIGGSFADSCGHLSTGIGETQILSTVLVYPNPASETATFQFSSSGETRTIIVCDELGAEIWRRETNESMVEFPASQFCAGIYFYSIIQSNSRLTSGKFLIED